MRNQTKTHLFRVYIRHSGNKIKEKTLKRKKNAKIEKLKDQQGYRKHSIHFELKN